MKWKNHLLSHTAELLARTETLGVQELLFSPGWEATGAVSLQPWETLRPGGRCMGRWERTEKDSDVSFSILALGGGGKVTPKSI